jgi:hypothetical protein
LQNGRQDIVYLENEIGQSIDKSDDSYVHYEICDVKNLIFHAKCNFRCAKMITLLQLLNNRFFSAFSKMSLLSQILNLIVIFFELKLIFFIDQKIP